MITVMHVQNRIFIGSVFQIEVSDTSILLHLPYSKEHVYLLEVRSDRGTNFWNSVCLGVNMIRNFKKSIKITTLNLQLQVLEISSSELLPSPLVEVVQNCCDSHANVCCDLL